MGFDGFEIMVSAKFCIGRARDDVVENLLLAFAWFGGPFPLLIEDNSGKWFAEK